VANTQININTFHPVVAILSTVLRVSHSAKPLGLNDPKFISLTTIHIGKRIKDKKERVFGSASNEHYIRRA
jgi:hypothetical protein